MTTIAMRELLATHRTASDLYVLKMTNGYLGDKQDLMAECLDEANQLMGLIKNNQK